MAGRAGLPGGCSRNLGGLTGAAVDLGAVFRRALAASAASVIVLHTRCGGEPAPTAHDWAFTRRLVAAGKTLGVAVFDHLIVASAERWVSLRRREQQGRRPAGDAVAAAERSLHHLKRRSAAVKTAFP